MATPLSEQDDPVEKNDTVWWDFVGSGSGRNKSWKGCFFDFSKKNVEDSRRSGSKFRLQGQHKIAFSILNQPNKLFVKLLCINGHQVPTYCDTLGYSSMWHSFFVIVLHHQSPLSYLKPASIQCRRTHHSWLMCPFRQRTVAEAYSIYSRVTLEMDRQWKAAWLKSVVRRLSQSSTCCSEEGDFILVHFSSHLQSSKHARDANIK